MFAKLANNRKLEEATSAKDDVAPSKLLYIVVVESADVFEIQVTPTVQCTCWMRSPNLQTEVVRLLKVWQMPLLKGSGTDLQL